MQEQLLVSEGPVSKSLNQTGAGLRAANSNSAASLIDVVEFESSDNIQAKKTRKGGKEQASGKELDWGRLWEQGKPERCILAWATTCLLFGTLLNLAIPALIGSIIDIVSGAKLDVRESALRMLLEKLGFEATTDNLLRAAVAVLGVVITVGSFFSFLRGYLYTMAGERVVARLRKNLFDAIIVADVAFFDETRTGELINRLSADTSLLKNALTVNISMALRWLATVVGGIVYLFLISWKLTLVMLSIVPLVAIGGRFYGGKMKTLSKQTQDALAKATETAEESFSHIRTVRSFSRESYQSQLYADRIETTYQLGVKAAWLYGLFIGVFGFVASSAIVGVLWYGANLVLQKEITPGVLTSFMLYSLTVGAALGGLSGLFGNFMQALGANERVFAIIDKKPLIPIAGGHTVSPISAFSGLCRFDNVSFRYAGRPEMEVLKQFSLELKPGTMTALVGPSGGGKSTVVALLERFYDASSGCITIDGKALQDYDLSWLHKRIGLINQEPVLFATTIAENLTYGIGKSQVSEEQMIRACEMANCHDFITAFPEGYHTMVGERGIKLSGGQKQRVAIARAILMDPVILIADEATSSLDAESEFHVQEALDRLMKGRTVLVIAHRLSTVKRADNVVVLQHGRVAEHGTHSALLALGGLYAQLVARQLDDK